MKYGTLLLLCLLAGLPLVWGGCGTTPGTGARERGKETGRGRADEKRVRTGSHPGEGGVASAVKGRAKAADPAPLQGDEIYVVGKIRLLPALTDAERSAGGEGRGARGAVYFANRFVDLSGSGPGGAWEYDEIPLDEHFVLKVKAAKRLYYSGTLVPLWGGEGGLLNLPGDRVYEVRAGTKAIYAGTMVYYRNYRNDIDKITYFDEFEAARKVLQETPFGRGLTLERARQTAARQR